MCAGKQLVDSPHPRCLVIASIMETKPVTLINTILHEIPETIDQSTTLPYLHNYKSLPIPPHFTLPQIIFSFLLHNGSTTCLRLRRLCRQHHWRRNSDNGGPGVQTIVQSELPIVHHRPDLLLVLLRILLRVLVVVVVVVVDDDLHHHPNKLLDRDSSRGRKLHHRTSA